MSDSNRPNIITARVFGEEDFTPQVYISYRPEDNEKIVRAVRDWFFLHLGPVNVVIDVSIPPFVEFIDSYIREKMRECNIFVPIIGPEWLSLLHMRMENTQEDRMRIETRVALEENLAIAPVYIAGAAPLREIDLPGDITALSTQKFSRLDSTSNFEDNMLAIIEDLKIASNSHHSLLGRIDVDRHYSAFEDAMQEDRLEDALRYLNEIHEYGIIPRPFRLQLRQRIRTVKRKIQMQAGGPLYNHIAELIETNPAEAYEKLTRFIAKYPEIGDPDDLMGQLVQPSNDVISLLKELEKTETDGYRRLEIGQQISELGDPRQGVGLRPDGLPDIAWLKVQEGDFIFSFDRHIDMPEFFISKYPVTYSQFKVFVDDGGFENDDWWDGLAERETEETEQRWKIDNYPRIRVSWYAAVAFCRWLSHHTGTEVRLPTEAEWEKATRGVNGLIYPWGASYIPGYSNINEAMSGISPTNLREPSSVGAYPHAASPYGVLDLIGNVYEWCYNEYSEPAAMANEVDVTIQIQRPLRGGSWRSDRLFAHSVRRRGELPATSFNDIGFRIVCNELPAIAID